MIPLLALGYLACAVLTYGISFAYWMYFFPESRRGHRYFSLWLASLGPCGLIAIFIYSGFARHGLKYW